SWREAGDERPPNRQAPARARCCARAASDQRGLLGSKALTGTFNNRAIELFGNRVIGLEIVSQSPINCQITRLSNYPIHETLREQPRELRGVHSVAGEDRVRIVDAQVADDNFAEDIAEIGGDCQVASFVAALCSASGPAAVPMAA